VNFNDFNDKIIYNTKVKRYRDGSYTLTYCNRRVFVNQGEKQEFIEFCESEETEKSENTGKAKVTEIVNKFEASKLSETPKKRKEERTDNMKRAVDKVYDLAFQNEWSYFMTITIDPEQFDRQDVKEVYKKLSAWLRNQVSRKGLKYLLIPEQHKNGGIHAHALINDCFKLEHSGRYLYSGKAYKSETLQKKGIDINLLKPVYNVPEWKYGFSTAIPVDGNPARLACYITKYITKDCKKIFGKYYLSSRNLNRDTEISLCNSEKFDELKNNPLYRGGMAFKYSSDFRLDPNDDREVPDDILEYLAKRGAL
jgi:hypothetical protein